jgi:hypothetical protein
MVKHLLLPQMAASLYLGLILCSSIGEDRWTKVAPQIWCRQCVFVYVS